MERPKVTKEMIIEAATKIAERLGGDAETIAEYYDHPMDGYQLAKELDRNAYWDLTMSDVEELDGMSSIVERLHSEAEKKWFAENNIQPPYPIGTRIRDRRWKDREVGCIDGIYQHGVAKYLMKPDGQDDEATGNRRLIIKFEDAEEVA